jgi:hypothetical protein
MHKLFLVILTPIIVFTTEDLNITKEKDVTTEANLSVMMRQLSMVDNEERFLLMNAIKRKLVKLKMQQRTEAINRLRSSMQRDSDDSNITIDERAIKEIRIMPQHLENRPNAPHQGNRPPHRPPPRK